MTDTNTTHTTTETVLNEGAAVVANEVVESGNEAVIETGAEVVAETAGTAEALVEAIESIDIGTNEAVAPATKHERAPRRELPVRTTTLKRNERFAGKDTVIEEFFTARFPGKLLLTVKKDGVDERGVLCHDGLHLENAGRMEPAARTAALMELIEKMSKGEVPLPETLVVSRIDRRGASFNDLAFDEKNQKRREVKKSKAAQSENLDAVRAMAGKVIKDVRVVGKLVKPYTDPKSGTVRDGIVGVFCRLVGEGNASVDGFLHVKDINGGRRAADQIVVNETVFPMLKVGENMEEVTRHGMPGLKVSLSETETFPYSAGDTVRGATFERPFNHDLVFVKEVNGLRYELYLSEDALAGVKKESIAKRDQSTSLKFVGFDRSRIVVTKAGVK